MTPDPPPSQKWRRPNYTFNCWSCGVEVSKYVRPSWERPRFCCKSCATSFSMRNPERREAAKRGADSHRWRGAGVSEKGGRKRALKMYPDAPCERCGAENSERHHKDANTANNEPENIERLCRRCHMEADGRMDAARQQMRALQPKGSAARWRR